MRLSYKTPNKVKRLIEIFEITSPIPILQNVPTTTEGIQHEALTFSNNYLADVLKKHYCLTSKYLKNIVYNYVDKVMTMKIEILSKLNWEQYDDILSKLIWEQYE